MSLSGCLQKIKEKYSYAIEEKCEESGCKLLLNDLHEFVILKGEKVCSGCKICDFIIFVPKENYVITGIVELKSKTTHANEIIEKLKNCLNRATEIMNKCCERNIEQEFYLLVLARGWKTPEYNVIKKRKVEVGNKKYDILLKSCGTSFKYIIDKFS